MAWDKDLPSGSLSIAQGDNDIRANNTAIEAALGLEHEFSTGGTNSGRHSFTVDTTAAISALSNPQTGSIALNTSLRSGADLPRASLVYYNGSAWVPADINPLDGSGNTTVARVDENNEFTLNNYTLWKAITPGAGSPNTLAIDFSLGGLQFAVISNDTEIQVPTMPTSGYGAQVVLYLTMSGAGHAITWAGSGVWHSPYGITPAYNDASGAVNMFFLTKMAGGDDVLVTTAPSVSTF